ncbi:flagellar hook assembly protein FlgD [Bacillus solimangrovi]|uniref:Basal-body rod modification protein FlgD n=1 Tax=Bacillus solimangrovi TaxID=1305675 RepID=A0A1E5LB11_9BACI|nr:flagellar hook assembly protein FlgD [Bacillus solimangrovi]OEH91265.1 hypothetical protein BFG57_06505 [Bacillus solimangrovi]
MTTVDPSLYLQNYQSQNTGSGSNVLDKDAFIKILMTQLQNQDPSSPMEDKEFIAQMAQFSALEQTTNLNETMNNFINLEKQTQLVYFSEMIGKDILFEREVLGEEDTEPITETGQGTIKGVTMENGYMVYHLEDGTIIPETQVTEIQKASKHVASDNLISQASSLIGKNVTWTEEVEGQDGEIINETNQSIVSSVSFKDGKVTYVLESGHSIKGSDIVEISR